MNKPRLPGKYGARIHIREDVVVRFVSVDDKWTITLERMDTNTPPEQKTYTSVSDAVWAMRESNPWPDLLDHEEVEDLVELLLDLYIETIVNAKEEV